MNTENLNNTGKVIYHSTVIFGGGGGFIWAILNLRWFLEFIKNIELSESLELVVISVFILIDFILSMGILMSLILFFFYLIRLLKLADLFLILKGEIPNSWLACKTDKA